MPTLTTRQARANQLRYIAEERKRMAKLDKALQTYTTAARKLGLHPLTRTEIVDRLFELNAMEREANTPEYAARQVAFAAFMEG